MLDDVHIVNVPAATEELCVCECALAFYVYLFTVLLTGLILSININIYKNVQRNYV